MIETKKNTQKPLIENMKKNINKEILLKKLNVDLDNEISAAMLKHNALLAIIPGRPSSASTDSGLSMYSERGVHVSTQTGVKHYNNGEVESEVTQYSNVDVQTKFVSKLQAIPTDDFVNENRPKKVVHDGTVGAAPVQAKPPKCNKTSHMGWKKDGQGNITHDAKPEVTPADNSTTKPWRSSIPPKKAPRKSVFPIWNQ